MGICLGDEPKSDIRSGSGRALGRFGLQPGAINSHPLFILRARSDFRSAETGRAESSQRRFWKFSWKTHSNQLHQEEF